MKKIGKWHFLPKNDIFGKNCPSLQFLVWSPRKFSEKRILFIHLWAGVGGGEQVPSSSPKFKKSLHIRVSPHTCANGGKIFWNDTTSYSNPVRYPPEKILPLFTKA
jgi:hypothetical protein